MKSRTFDYLYIVSTIVLTAYGQIILKWRIQEFGSLPVGFSDKVRFLLTLLLDPAIFSGFAAAFLAALAWMAAVSKFDLSHAYPILSLNFAVVLILSAWMLGEPMTWQKTAGVSMIILGTILASQG
jgi:drug/metabolite transporter (DMT)-like permease